jgi:hypothetical protein
MNCNDLIGRTADYTGGTLEPERSEEIEEHLRDCKICAAFLNTYLTICCLGKEIPTKKISADFQARLFSSILEKVKREKPPASLPFSITDDKPSHSLQLLSKET